MKSFYLLGLVGCAAVAALTLFGKPKSKVPLSSPEIANKEVKLPEVEGGSITGAVTGAIIKGVKVLGKTLGVAGAAVTTTSIGLSALPAATLLPSGVVSMAPATLTSSVYAGGAGVSPSASSALASSPVTGGSGVAGAIGGAALCVAPLVVMPVIAKVLDSIFGIGKSGLYDNPELLAKQQEITKEKMELIAASDPGDAVPLWIPKTGFYEGEGG